MTEKKIKEKNKYLEYLKRIIGVLALIMVLRGCYQAQIFAKFYDSDIDTVLENIGEYTSSISLGEYQEGLKEISYRRLSGIKVVDTVEITQEQSLGITATAKKGEVKLLVLDGEDEVILFDKISDKVSVNLTAGTYRIIAVGKSYTGKITIENNIE